MWCISVFCHTVVPFTFVGKIRPYYAADSWQSLTHPCKTTILAFNKYINANIVFSLLKKSKSAFLVPKIMLVTYNSEKNPGEGKNRRAYVGECRG